MEDLLVNDRITIPAAELQVSFARSGGPGGQNVNKVNTKVILRWSPGDSAALTETDRTTLLQRWARRLTTEGELVITSSRTRLQARNRQDARDKLAEAIRNSLKPKKKRKKTRPSRAARKKRLNDKKHRSKMKQSRKPVRDE